MSQPIKLYGPGILTLPVGFLVASTFEDQIDVLYGVADNPNTPRDQSEKLLRLIRKITIT